MPIAIEKILVSFSLILLCTLFIGTYAVDVPNPDHIVQSKHDQNSADFVRYMAKRRFLPTRRELHQYVSGELSNENDEDESHLNAKRYFLKSKRYFLNSKRDNERREDE